MILPLVKTTTALASVTGATERVAEYSTTLVSTLERDPLLFGVVVYAGSFAALSLWETFVVPRFNLDSTLPETGSLTRSEKEVPFVTPWTADLPVPPPPYERLDTPFRVAKRGDVGQFIVSAPDGCPTKDGVAELNEEWTKYYGDPVLIFKRKL